MSFKLDDQSTKVPELEIRQRYVQKILEQLELLDGLYHSNPVAYRDALKGFLNETIGDIGTDFVSLERKNSGNEVVDQ